MHFTFNITQKIRKELLGCLSRSARSERKDSKNRWRTSLLGLKGKVLNTHFEKGRMSD